MRAPLVIFVLLSLWAAEPAAAQLGLPGDEAEALHYVVQRNAAVYAAPGGGKKELRLAFREPVVVLSAEDGWSHVRTKDGTLGYVREEAVSNVWIRVSKRRKRVFLYRGMDLVLEAHADFGYNAYSDKVRRGGEAERDHWRTPEGVFYVVRRNAQSEFYKAFVLNYPNAEDAARGYQDGLITRRERDAILRADKSSRMPPMTTDLGGMIEIHGGGTGYSTNWTQGCVALQNEDLDTLWGWVQEGTPVIMEK